MRAIYECLPKHKARAEFRFGGFNLEVRAAGRYYDFVPQYAVFDNGKIVYTPALARNTTHFIGWRHYVSKRWELSNNKLAFKSYCTDANIRVPRMFTRAEDVTADVILKRKQSSFGDGILGPFQPSQFRDNGPQLHEGEYFEEFIRGEIAKIWYWNDRVAALEVKPMVEVTGDGKASLRRLVAAIASRIAKVDWSAIEHIARYQGISSIDEVVPQDTSVLVDFRYLSGLHPFRQTNQNVLDKYQRTPVLAQMDYAGRFFWTGIPEEIRRNTLYTIDAIIAPDQTVYFLEMNSNPIVHPDTYAAMFDDLFAIPATPRAPTLSTPSQEAAEQRVTEVASTTENKGL